MCIRPQKIINKRYLPTRKNNYNPPVCTDKRLYEIEIPCGSCIECRKRKARDWSIRLQEEIKRDTYFNGVKQTPLFVTLTINDESAKKLTEKYNLIDANDVAKKAVRLMLERYRKKNKKSFKHWLITELGENNGRLHMHGIIWLNINQPDLEKLWSYGYIYIGQFVSPASINYITNYSLKINNQFANYRPAVCCSPKIGENYLSTDALKLKQFNDKNTNDYYTLPSGQKVALPKYYRNKIYNETEREKLFINKIEEEEIYVCGVKVNKNDIEKINKLRDNTLKQEEKWGLPTGKAAKYDKPTTNQIFNNIDDNNRERQHKVKKQKKLKEYIHGERIFHENYNNINNIETENFIFMPNGTFIRKYNLNDFEL